jgi:hypothetical protein
MPMEGPLHDAAAVAVSSHRQAAPDADGRASFNCNLLALIVSTITGTIRHNLGQGNPKEAENARLFRWK